MVLSALRYEDIRKEICSEIGLETSQQFDSNGKITKLDSNGKIIITENIISKTNSIKSSVIIEEFIRNIVGTNGKNKKKEEYTDDIESKKPLPIQKNDDNKNHKKENFHFVKQEEFNECPHINNTDTKENDNVIVKLPDNPNKNDDNKKLSIDGRTAYKDDPDYYFNFIKPIRDSIDKMQSNLFL